MTEIEIDELYHRAFNGDAQARLMLLNLAGKDSALDGKVIVCLSCLEGPDTYKKIVSLAKMGNPEAICSYGYEKILRATSSKDIIQGLCWLEESGELGCSRAWGLLGDLHGIGDYVERDRMLAMKYYAKAYFAGNQGAAYPLAKLLYDYLEISDVMLGDAIDWLRVCVERNLHCDAAWQLKDVEDRYGEDKINAAPRMIPKDFGARKMEFYIGQYGHPKFGFFS